VRFQPEVLRKLMKTYDYQLKFVVAQSGDLDEIERVVEQIKADRGKVILMPEGIDPSVLHERGVWLAEIAKRRGFRFTPRLHVDLWGNRRGV
jgi:7-carboxy-7-deazaguanine synthase